MPSLEYFLKVPNGSWKNVVLVVGAVGNKIGPLLLAKKNTTEISRLRRQTLDLMSSNPRHRPSNRGGFMSIGDS